MALAGSWAGTGGISTSPAPRLPRDDPPVLACVPRVPALPWVPAVPAEAGDEPPSGRAALHRTGDGAPASPPTAQHPASIEPPQPGWGGAARPGRAGP